MSWSVPNDWYPRKLPDSIRADSSAFIATSYCFGGYAATADNRMSIGAASGIYDTSSIITGAHGRIVIGNYTCINGANLLSQELISIGSYCLLSWGVVVTDWAPDKTHSRSDHQRRMRALSKHPNRTLEVADARPVTIEDNCWIGFEAIVGPGVTIGEGSIVGSRSHVTADVAPYTVVIGNPARKVRSLPRPDNPRHDRATP